MHQFITALRELRRPIVLLAVGTVVVQTLVAGIASASAAARIAAFGADAGVICHGNGSDPAGTGSGRPIAHDCCVFCTAEGPAAAPAGLPVLLARLDPERRAEGPAARVVRPLPRAVRAGPSQAPPIAA